MQCIKLQAVIKNMENICMCFLNCHSNQYTTFQNSLRENKDSKNTQWTSCLRNMALGQRSANSSQIWPATFLPIKFYWNTTTHIHSYISYGCFHIPLAELNAQHGNCIWPPKPKIFISSLNQKNSPTLLIHQEKLWGIFLNSHNIISLTPERWKKIIIILMKSWS